MQKKIFIVSAMLLLSACGDPLAGIDRITDVELAEDNTAARVTPTDEEIAREGFFGTSAATGEDTAPLQAAPEPRKRRGLLGLLRRNDPTPSETEVSDTEKPPQIDADTEVQAAALTPEPVSAPTGFFGRKRPKGTAKPSNGPDAQVVPYGTVLPYGVVARVCDAKGKSLGQKVDQASAKGYALYDSTPGSAVARTYYITGFDDGCPRQVTAANVLLGAPSGYEALHYGPAGAHLTVAATDVAYEKVKSRVCGVRAGKPCGSKMKRMEKTTFFVSAYDSFGNSARWSELLIHDGAVVAMAIKTNG